MDRRLHEHDNTYKSVIPACFKRESTGCDIWIPAYAVMTPKKSSMIPLRISDTVYQGT